MILAGVCQLIRTKREVLQTTQRDEQERVHVAITAFVIFLLYFLLILPLKSFVGFSLKRERGQECVVTILLTH